MKKMYSPRVFVSHSHHDKSVARRLVRRMSAHGIAVWLDERDLPIGTPLTPSIEEHIRGVDTLLVVASRAAARSSWVDKEIDLARDLGKPIIPLFVEAVSDHPRFAEHKGLDATARETFAFVLDTLMRELHLVCDSEMPAPDPAVLEAELRELATLEPCLAPARHRTTLRSPISSTTMRHVSTPRSDVRSSASSRTPCDSTRRTAPIGWVGPRSSTSRTRKPSR